MQRSTAGTGAGDGELVQRCTDARDGDSRDVKSSTADRILLDFDGISAASLHCVHGRTCRTGVQGRMRGVGMGEVTIQQVATAAGVSPSTVSNLLNGRSHRMLPETRQRIETAIDKLGYRPNRAARQLRTGRNQTIGLVVPSVGNPFWGALARHLESRRPGRGLSRAAVQLRARSRAASATTSRSCGPTASTASCCARRCPRSSTSCRWSSAGSSWSPSTVPRRRATRRPW